MCFIRIKIILITLLSGLVIPACSLTQKLSPEQAERMGLPPEQYVVSEGGEFVAPKSTDPGMVHIQRKTKGYTISMILDATDENVYFVMDLPEDGSTEVEELSDGKQDKKSEQKADEGKAKESPDSLATRHVVNAQTLFFEKRYDRALLEIERSLQFSPDSPTAHSLKGSIHYKLGERRAARSAWEKALELDPGMDDVKLMLSKLNR